MQYEIYSGEVFASAKVDDDLRSRILKLPGNRYSRVGTVVTDLVANASVVEQEEILYLADITAHAVLLNIFFKQKHIGYLKAFEV